MWEPVAAINLFQVDRDMKLVMTLLCKGTCATVSPPFKGQEGSAPVIHPRSGVPAWAYY